MAKTKEPRKGELLTVDQAAVRWGVKRKTLSSRVMVADLRPVVERRGRMGARYWAKDLKLLATTRPERDPSARPRPRPAEALEIPDPIEVCCRTYLLTDADRRELVRRRARLSHPAGG